MREIFLSSSLRIVGKKQSFCTFGWAEGSLTKDKCRSALVSSHNYKTVNLAFMVLYENYKTRPKSSVVLSNVVLCDPFFPDVGVALIFVLRQ